MVSFLHSQYLLFLPVSPLNVLSSAIHAHILMAVPTKINTFRLWPKAVSGLTWISDSAWVARRRQGQSPQLHLGSHKSLLRVYYPHQDENGIPRLQIWKINNQASFSFCQSHVPFAAFMSLPAVPSPWHSFPCDVRWSFLRGLMQNWYGVRDFRPLEEFARRLTDHILGL